MRPCLAFHTHSHFYLYLYAFAFSSHSLHNFYLFLYSILFQPFHLQFLFQLIQFPFRMCVSLSICPAPAIPTSIPSLLHSHSLSHYFSSATYCFKFYSILYLFFNAIQIPISIIVKQVSKQTGQNFCLFITYACITNEAIIRTKYLYC